MALLEFDSMKILDVVKYGDPVLREKAQPFHSITPDVIDLAQAMLDTMYHTKGVGLAAQQVGITKSICVIDVPEGCEDDDETEEFNAKAVEMPLVMINPSIIATSGEQPGKEGCLSFPSIGGNVTRPMEATAQYIDLLGKQQVITVRGFLARAVLHETDHLNGVLYIDRMSEDERKLHEKKLLKLVRKNGGVE